MPRAKKTTETPDSAARAALSPKTREGQDVAPQFKLRMRATHGDLIAIGPGKIALLEALDEAGSITAAAKALGMSYRRAWLLIDELNQSLREPAVATAAGGAQGGGSELTRNGRALVTLYRRIETEALKHCAGDIRKLMKMLAG